jgi:hypothetical protein
VGAAAARTQVGESYRGDVLLCALVAAKFMAQDGSSLERNEVKQLHIRCQCAAETAIQ